jgi:hypothetical protein
VKPKLVSLPFKNSVRTSKRTPYFPITEINWLTLFTEVIPAYSENHTKPINENAGLIADTDGTYSYHWALKGWGNNVAEKYKRQTTMTGTAIHPFFEMPQSVVRSTSQSNSLSLKWRTAGWTAAVRFLARTQTSPFVSTSGNQPVSYRVGSLWLTFPKHKKAGEWKICGALPPLYIRLYGVVINHADNFVLPLSFYIASIWPISGPTDKD